MYDNEERVLDISDIWTSPYADLEAYRSHAWHAYADYEEVYKDLNYDEDNLPWEWKESALKARAANVKRLKIGRREASAGEKQQYKMAFHDAKYQECQSWGDNEVYNPVDMRYEEVQNFITGRWVLTVKRDKQGNFEKCKARWVLRGFQDLSLIHI